MFRRRTEPSPGKEIVLDPSTHRLNFFPDISNSPTPSSNSQIFHDAGSALSSLYPVAKTVAKEVTKAVSTYINKSPKSVPQKPIPKDLRLPGPLKDPKKNIVPPIDIVNLATETVKLLGSIDKSGLNKTETNQLIKSAVNTVVQRSVGDFSKIAKMRNNRLSSGGRSGGNSRVVARAPVAKSVRVRQSNKPRYSTANGNIVISHSELIGTITGGGTSTFACKGYVINPGKVDMFSWLSTIAGNYDKYKLRKLTVSFVSCKPTSTGGKIGIGIDYDSTDPVPTDRGEFYTLTHHVECAPWDSISFSPPLQGGVKFINSHTVTDSKLIDYGQILVFSDQLAAADGTSILGDIIIDYEIELIDAQQASFETMVVKYADGATTLVPDSVYPTVVGPASVALRSSSATTLSYYLYEGYYMLTAAVHDDNSGGPTITAAKSSGITAWKAYATDTQMATYTMWAKVVGDSQYVTWTVGTVAVTDLELALFSFTRISATAYNNASGATVS